MQNSLPIPEVSQNSEEESAEQFLTAGRFRAASRIAAAIVAIISGLGFVGWQANIDLLKSIVPGGETIKPSAALCFLLASVALWILGWSEHPTRERKLAARTCAAIVVFLAGIALGEYLFSQDFGIDRILDWHHSIGTGHSASVRMALATALSLTLSGTALALLPTRGKLLILSQCFAILTVLVGLITLEVHLFGMTALDYSGAFSSVAINTAICMVLIGFAILFARPETGVMRTLASDFFGGIMARHLLPVVILLPIIIGWVRMQGQKAGLYNTEFGLALFATSNIIIVSVVVWLSARFLNRAELNRDAQNRKAQAELYASQQRYRKLVELSPDAVFTNRSDRIEFANAACLAMLGAEREDQLIGRKLEEIFPPSRNDLIAEKIRRFLEMEGVAPPTEEKIVKMDGTIVEVEIAAASHRDTQGMVVQVILRDISARKRSAEALRQSEEHLRLAVLGARLGTWHWNIAEDEMFWSDECKKLFGLPTDASPSYALFMSILHPEDRKRVDIAVETALREHTEYASEYRIILTGGEVRWIYGLGRGYYDAASTPTRMEGVILDITERKQSDEKLASVTSQMRALALRLQSIREQERTNLAREIHDVLAQELTRLKIDAVWMSKRLVHPVEDPTRETLSKKVREMTTQIDSTITTVQKIATELRPVVLDSLGLPAAVEWLAEDFNNRTGIRCDAKVFQESAPIDRGITTALFRILQESLTNVVRHAHATEVSVTLEKDDASIVLQIHDNGKGIPQERLQDAHSIGLIGMRERAQAFNGTFGISSSSEMGTMIVISIPVPGTNLSTI